MTQRVKTDAITTTYTFEAYPVGSTYLEPADEVNAANSAQTGDREWVFIKATGAITAGHVVARQTTGCWDGNTAGADALTITLLGGASHAIASGSYGWIVKRGCVDLISASSLSIGTHIISAASGEIDDTALAAGTASQGGQILGHAIAAVSGSEATANTPKTMYISVP